MSNVTQSENEYQVLLDVVRLNYANVVWTHKIQEKQADIYAAQYKQLESFNVILAAATSCGAVSIFTNPDAIVLKIVTVVLSFATTAVTACLKSFDLKNLEKQHKDAANNFLVIRNELLQVIAEIHMQKKMVSEIDKEFHDITENLNSLYLSAPSTTAGAVASASKALGPDREYTYTDAEIDRFLPPTLRGPLKKKENANGNSD